MRGPWLFLKARSGWWLPVVCLVMALILVSLPDTLAGVPLRTDAQMLPRLAIGSFPAGLGYLAMRPPGPMIERNHVTIRIGRSVWWAIVVLCLVLSSVLPLIGSNPAIMQAVIRNSTLLAAIGTLSGVAFGYEYAWVCPLAVVGLITVYGSKAIGGEAYQWALLERPPDDALSWAATITLAAAAWLTYAMRDLVRPRFSKSRLTRRSNA